MHNKMESKQLKGAPRQPYPWRSIFGWSAWVFAAGFVSGFINAKSYPLPERIVGGVFVGLTCALLTGIVVGAFKYFRREGTTARYAKEEGASAIKGNASTSSSISDERDGKVTHEQEERLYKQIVQEIETEAIDKALWTKAFAEAEGNETQTRVLYIKGLNADSCGSILLIA